MELVGFAKSLEEACVETVEQGKMTKDLALLIGENQEFLTTEAFMDNVGKNFNKKVA